MLVFTDFQLERQNLLVKGNYSYDVNTTDTSYRLEGPGGSISQVVGIPNNSYKPITNTAWVRARLCKLQKGCTRLSRK